MKIVPKIGGIEALQKKSLNWKRIMSALRRSHQDYPVVDQDKLSVVEEQLKALCEVVGFWSISRRALSTLGEALLHTPEGELKIICPVCIDRQEIMGGTKVPEVISHHIRFIESVRRIIPITSVTFLFAAYAKNQPAEVRQTIQQMCVATQESLLGTIYCAREMDEYLPNIRACEERVKAELGQQGVFYKALVKRLTPERRRYCVNRGIDEKFLDRAISKSIAEFIGLGRHASCNGILICCHTTGRIRCFLKAGAGVLHNPISVE